MLPKILVGNLSGSREKFFEKENLNENFVLAIDAAETNLQEFREWILFCQNVLDDEGVYSMVVWNAGKLSLESQSVLLKPLEEKKTKTRMYLLTEKEANLLPTILSRCEIELESAIEKKDEYWGEIVKTWRGGPGSILDYSEKFKTENLEILLSEIVLKVKKEMKNEVNKRRIHIIDLAFETLQAIYQTNVNRRMALESFLFRGWKVIKT